MRSVALAGLSGSGKSTLALSLLRLLHYRGGEVSGSIRLAGRELSGLSEREMRSLRGKLIGYVPQSPAAALNGRLRVRTLLNETWRAHSKEPAAQGLFADLLESVQLPAGGDFSSKRAGELSTGQGQRLLIALAIMHRPPVVLADEPTSSLDAITQAAVLRLFEDLNRRHGTAMLFHFARSVVGSVHRTPPGDPARRPHRGIGLAGSNFPQSPASFYAGVGEGNPEARLVMRYVT